MTTQMEKARERRTHVPDETRVKAPMQSDYTPRRDIVRIALDIGSAVIILGGMGFGLYEFGAASAAVKCILTGSGVLG